MRTIIPVLTGLLLFSGVAGASAQTALKGSRTAMVRQNSVAQKEDYSFLQTPGDVRRFVEKGLLVPVHGSSSVKLADVSFPYARPAVKTFIERLGPQYKNACGEKLVITSLTRPLTRQPTNASDLSVHPAGMALDLRISRRDACRNWLERTLVGLEKKGVLDVTKERNPAHYHVAIFPNAYLAYVSALTGDTKLAARTAKQPGIKIATSTGPSYASILPTSDDDVVEYRVRTGDTLWSIARKAGVSVDDLKRANHMRGSTIKVGQQLRIPAAGPERATE